MVSEILLSIDTVTSITLSHYHILNNNYDNRNRKYCNSFFCIVYSLTKIKIIKEGANAGFRNGYLQPDAMNILLVTRAMSVSISHCELKWEIPSEWAKA